MGLLGSIGGAAVGAIGSLIGGNMAANNQQALAGMNYEAQKEFAQNGIRWKVADAKAAGIHPLYALGASTQGYSPSGGYGGDYGISDAFNQFGQGISRAVEAKQTKEERDRLEVRQALQDMVVMDKLSQEKRMNDAQVRLIDSEIARNMAAAQFSLKRTALPPGMPSPGDTIPGQGDSKMDTLNKYAWAFTPSGKRELTFSPDYKQQYEDMPIVEYLPVIESLLKNATAILGGQSIDGRRYSFRDFDWIPEKQSRRYNKDFANSYRRNASLPW